jgi:predicted Zn-dependent protease
MTQQPPELDRNAIGAIFNVAVARYGAGAIDEAIAILQLLSFLAPRDRGVWLALAQCHEELGHEAVADSLRCLADQIQEVAA